MTTKPIILRWARTFLLIGVFMTSTCCYTPCNPSYRDGPLFMIRRGSRSYGDEEAEERAPFQSRLESPVDDDTLPLRKRAALPPNRVYTNDWGVERYEHPEPSFPDSVESLTDAAMEAVAGTLYGKQRLDPNLASNAMSPSIFGYRPVRGKRDIGRIGLEIDGAKFLFSGESSGTAIRRVALQLGAKLAQGPWEGFEEEGGPLSRPVAIYFNTIKQALIASQELLWLKRLETENTGSKRSRFDHITLSCLHQDEGIPKHMRQTKRTYGGLGKGIVDPTKGIVLVVQPTDYNKEFRPPGPSIGAVAALQQLAARATAYELPTVIISPRFLAHDHFVDVGRGWDQSSYQQSAVYGGAEPPKGPSPWLMRDFSPPVFAWVGCSLPLSPHLQPNNHKSLSRADGCCTRVVLTQSVMQEGHAWHLFAAKEYDHHKVDYEYLASTKTSSGRPPKAIIQHIYSEWHS